MDDKKQGMDVTNLSRPTLVIGTRLAIQIHTFLIVENAAEPVFHARWDSSYAFKWTVFRYRIDDALPRCSPQRLFVRIVYGSDRAVHPAQVPSEIGCVKGAIMMVAETGVVKAIDGISALEVLLSEVVSSMSFPGVATDHI